MPSLLTDTLIRLPRANGLHPLQRRGTHGSRDLSTFRLCLDAGGEATYHAADEETVVVLQRGSGTWTVDGRTHSISRRDVFEERATACYLPPGASLAVRAETPLEAVLFSAPASTGGAATVAMPADIQVNVRGKDGYTREVHDIFVRDSHVQRLMVGETLNPPGHWSSYPPHKHDGLDGEPRLEEVYCYRVDPPNGFGVQLLYAADGESITHQVRDGDVVVLPYGYHPVCAPPGYRLYYLWALVGAERKLALFEDPAHRWIHDARP